MQPRILFVLTSLLTLLASGAGAQTVLSFAGRDSLAYACYVEALTTVKTGRATAAQSLATCDAALANPLPAHDRAATFDNRGILKNALGDYAAAYSDFDNSIRLNNSLGDAWLNRGATLIRLNRVNEALNDIQQGLALGPTMRQVGYYDLGVAQQSLGRIPEAYASYRQALAEDPDCTPAANALKNFRVVPPGG